MIYCDGCKKDRPAEDFAERRPERTTMFGRPASYLVHVGTGARKGCHHRMVVVRGRYTAAKEQAL